MLSLLVLAEVELFGVVVDVVGPLLRVVAGDELLLRVLFAALSAGEDCVATVELVIGVVLCLDQITNTETIKITAAI
jgi:hypothetical protein